MGDSGQADGFVRSSDTPIRRQPAGSSQRRPADVTTTAWSLRQPSVAAPAGSSQIVSRRIARKPSSYGSTRTYLPPRSGVLQIENPVRRGTNWRPSSLTVSASPGDGLRTPCARATVRVQRILDQGRRHPAAREQRIACRVEAAHDPCMTAAPHEQPDRPPGPAHRAGRDEHRLVEAVHADDLVRAGSLEREAGRPADDAGALADATVEPGRTPFPSQLLEPELGLRRSIDARFDHVQHHLHARADALDEVRLGDVVRTRPEVERVRLGVRPSRTRARRPAGAGSRERASRGGGATPRRRSVGSVDITSKDTTGPRPQYLGGSGCRPARRQSSARRSPPWRGGSHAYSAYRS